MSDDDGTEYVLDIQGVSKRYGSATALGDVSLRIIPGEFLTLLGPSGSGKTTLLRLIIGFDTPSGGRILLNGEDISLLPPGERGIGMVFQNYALFPHMTVAQNIAYGLRLRKWPRRRRDERVDEMLQLMRLGDFGDRAITALSGGQQQRVALARALAYDPKILIMDEPLGALDRELRLQMEEEIRRIHRDLGTTFIYVTHDQQEALALSDRIAIMRGGDIVGVGSPEELFYRPRSAFVARFFANSNVLPAEVLSTDGATARVSIAGSELECAVHGPTGQVPGALAVRRRTLARTKVTPSLRVEGEVAETLLFGDEREVVVRTEQFGRVTALMEARTTTDITVGQRIELYAPADELVLVADDRGE